MTSPRPVAWIQNSAPSLRAGLLGLLLLIPGLWLLLHAQFSLLTFAMITLVVTVAWVLRKEDSILLVLLFLILLGDIRRIVAMYAGSPTNDPLLLVGPLFTIVVVLPIILRLRVADALSKSVLALSAMFCCEIVNPRQGGLTVGLSGAFFILIPFLWFWMGREYGSEPFLETVTYKLIIPIGVLAALLGIYQTYVGFLPWEQDWIKRALENGFTALNIGNGHIRSFGFSVNSGEYATLLRITSVFVIAAFFAGKRAYCLLLPVLLTAQVLASERGSILKLLLGLVFIWAVRGRDMRTWIPRVLLAAFVGMAVLVYSARQTAGGANPGAKLSANATAADAATSHVAQGLAHPLDQRYSTAGTHSQEILNGVVSGFKFPLGSGLGITTLGARRFGSGTTSGGSSEEAGPSEFDVSDVFVITGFVGGFIYILIGGLAFWAAALYVRDGPRALSYPIVGLLTCMLGNWMPAGNYAMGPLFWLYVGFLAQKYANQPRLAPVTI